MNPLPEVEEDSKSGKRKVSQNGEHTLQATEKRKSSGKVFPTIPDDKEGRGNTGKSKKIAPEVEEKLESQRKRSLNVDYVKNLDDMIPKTQGPISAAKPHRTESEHKGEESTVLVIGICGGACSGKTFIVKSIRNYLREFNYDPTLIKERNYLLRIPVKDEELTPEIINNYDFDHYKSIDWKLFENTIKSLSEFKPFNCPRYSLFENRPIIKTKKLKPSKIILIEGRLFLNNEYLRNRTDFIIYLDTDSDIMLSRAIIKQTTLKKISLEEILKKYENFIKPNFEKFVLPTKQYADMVIYNFAGENYEVNGVNESSQFLKMVKDWITLQMFKIDGIDVTLTHGMKNVQGNVRKSSSGKTPSKDNLQKEKEDEHQKTGDQSGQASNERKGSENKAKLV